MTLFNNMAFSLQLAKKKKDFISETVRRTAKALGLDHMLERKPSALSGGQRQRVALGRAIVRSPKVFLFDEPLSNLDAKMRVQMRSEISKLHAQLGNTMIYVTHDQVEAMTMGIFSTSYSSGCVWPPRWLLTHRCTISAIRFVLRVSHGHIQSQP
jgi:multiple sugar transport system ATP-binding protein